MIATLPPSFLAPGLIAHRGLHGPGVPENSLAAIEAAVAAGYGVEIDVQPSADGVAMVFHDGFLRRLLNVGGPVESLGAAELGRLPILDTAQTVPTLAEALALIAGRVPLLIEIKDRDGGMGSRVGALEEAVLSALDGYGGDVAVMSFNPHSVAYMARRAPGLPRGLVTAGFAPADWPDLPETTRARLRAIPDLDATGAAFVSHDARDLGSPRIAEIAARLPVLCWTIRSAADEARARHVAAAVTFEGYRP